MYAGGEVIGKHRWVSSGHQGHEKYNFQRGPDGVWYAAIPGRTRPKPRTKDGWLLIFISAEEGKGPLQVVGWYEDANFENQPIPRPEYKSNPNFETDDEGKRYKYFISARHAHLIPVDQRPAISIGDRMRRSPILYARGNGPPEPWRERLAEKAESLIRKSAPSVASARSSHPGRNGRPWYASKELKAEVDKEAIHFVKRKLKARYEVQDRQSDRCGYDLLATSKTSRLQLLVEVKGTSKDRPGFFMTPKELIASESSKWRLALVTNALTKPRCRLLTKPDVCRCFVIKPCSYVGTFKPND
jgi:hypothetical protein